MINPIDTAYIQTFDFSEVNTMSNMSGIDNKLTTVTEGVSGIDRKLADILQGMSFCSTRGSFTLDKNTIKYNLTIPANTKRLEIQKVGDPVVHDLTDKSENTLHTGIPSADDPLILYQLTYIALPQGGIHGKGLSTSTYTYEAVELDSDGDVVMENNKPKMKKYSATFSTRNAVATFSTIRSKDEAGNKIVSWNSNRLLLNMNADNPGILEVDLDESTCVVFGAGETYEWVAYCYDDSPTWTGGSY
jgi:hypothetical protein